jgi:hypothetical protein
MAEPNGCAQLFTRFMVLALIIAGVAIAAAHSATAAGL